MDSLKQAFDKIKEDITSLRLEIASLRQELSTLKQKQEEATTPTDTSTVNQQETPNFTTPTHIPTHQQALEGLKGSDLMFSTGNRGVPTDKPTDRQTNQQTDQQVNFPHNNLQNAVQNTLQKSSTANVNDFEKAREILDSLDSIKKGIRLKFKRLTPQEMLIFSTLYSLEEQNIGEISYKLIANNLNLSESSIRDYINKLEKKGIPLLKIRQNNKTVTLNISPDLKEIASLSTIIKLREL
jgi:DNA-binding MarR family transcriptional regulator